MALFGFGKKKEEKPVANNGVNNGAEKIETTCACGIQANTNGTDDVKNAKFIVLGACCKKSTETFINVKNAVLELGFKDEVLNVGDPLAISKYGVIQTPAFVINGKVVSYGKLIKVEEAKKMIENSGLTAEK